MKRYFPPLLLVGISLILLVHCQKGTSYDLIIQSGTIVAGDGNPWYRSDIGIRDELIIAIGNLSDARADAVIDAADLIVCPGFIDIHNHSDRNIITIPTSDNVLLQGVTTVVGGNCGGHSFPLSEQFKILEDKGMAINFCSLIGHNSIRREVMGLKMNAPTNSEMEAMKKLVDQEMRSGALGLSTGLAYMPGRYAETGEIISLARVVAQYDGIYASHIRDQGDKITQAIKEAIRVGTEAHLPVQISHIKLCIEPNWRRPQVITTPVEEARARGLEVFTDQYPYTATSSGFASSFPAWSLEGGNDSLKARLDNPELYREIKEHVIHKRLTSENRINKLKTIFIAKYSKKPDWEGLHLEAILKLLEKRPNISNGADLIIDIQKNGGASCVFFQMIEEDVETLMKLDYNMIGSDGGVLSFNEGVPHCRNYGTFPRVIHRYVKEREILSLEEAIRKMTSLPAQVMRLSDRGLIKKHMAADLVIFHPDEIRDTATYQNPHSYPEGIRYVIVNGDIAARDGKPTGTLAGKVLYGMGKRM